jgi:hypothetical protein
MDADGVRQALASFGWRSIGALTIGAGRSRATRPISFPAGGPLEVPLQGAQGEWLCDGSALAVTCGRRVMLLWHLEDRDAVRAVARRLAREVGKRRADRALRSCERQASSPHREREAVAA